jgi:hypothetical protein
MCHFRRRDGQSAGSGNRILRVNWFGGLPAFLQGWILGAWCRQQSTRRVLRTGGVLHGRFSELRQDVRGYEHHNKDIRDRGGILRLVANTRPTVIVHTAPSRHTTAQPRSPSMILIQMRSVRSVYLRPHVAGRRSLLLFICRRIELTVIGRTLWHLLRRKRAGTMLIPSTAWVFPRAFRSTNLCIPCSEHRRLLRMQWCKSTDATSTCPRVPYSAA